MRELSQSFMKDLLAPDGVLNPILTRVQKDHTLMLAIRDGFINIYYRGGNILRVKEHNKDLYQAFFDDQYNKCESKLTGAPETITSQADAVDWVASFPERKSIMDVYFAKYGKAEREFQQLVARENNFSSISNESEYFISDIEVTSVDPGARFDILAVRWPASKRKSGDHCRLALMEMKYGDGALGGSAGLLKHLQDMDSFIANTKGYASLLCTIEKQFNQLDELGLLKFNKGKSDARVRLDAGDKPEVVFLLANHNPRSSNLKTILETPEIETYAQSERFDLRFFVASFAGYGLHTDCMLSLDEFRKLLK